MDLKALIKRRGGYKAKLTQFVTYLEVVKSCDSLSTLQINELNIRLAKIEELYTDFDCTQNDIEISSEIPEEQYKERASFECQYFGAIAAAREVLSNQVAAADFDSAAGSGTVTGHKGWPKLKLPVLKIPTFTGQHHDWLEFRDTYMSLIHTDSTIPKISKFHYLRAALKDTAALIIGSLDFTAENYDNAWDLLCNRYNNKRLLVNTHIQSLFNMENLNKESAKALRNIIDTVNRNLRALKTLGIPTDGWDMLIIFMVTNKLDAITSREWETRRNDLNELPSLTEFNKFLKNRADALETIEEANNNTRRRHSDITHTRQKAFIANSQFSTTKLSSSCPLCKNNHAIYHCPKFKSLPIEARIQRVKSLKLCINCLGQGHMANNCRQGSCKMCHKNHNTLLHLNDRIQHSMQSESADIKSTSDVKSDTSSTSSVVLCSSNPSISSQVCDNLGDKVSLSSTHNQWVVLLSTAVITVKDHQGRKHAVRALLDNGSTSCFMTESLCAKLKLPTTSTSTVVEGLNHQSSCISKRCDIIISSSCTSYTENIQCFVVPRITQVLPGTRVDHTTLNIPAHIKLADSSYHTPSQIDILLGASVFWNVLCSNNVSLGKNKPTLSETKLGWLISGPVQQLHQNHHSHTVHCKHAIAQHDELLQDQLTQFFDLEAAPTHKPVSQEEIECELNFSKTTTRANDGRFVVTIPLKESPDKLGDSYQQALCRFISLERRFKRDPPFKALYHNFIKEYISLGHMSENKTPEKDKHAYIMPHHGVLRETSLSTKLRVVFEANAATTTGLSFNSIQRVGPIVQSDIISILIRFRQHKYVVTADVEKMYRMVNVHESQHSLQQILWRFEPHEALKQYTLNTVSYGTASAAYLATRCLVQLGKECTDKAVSDAIIQGFYVDDFSYGANNTSLLISTCKGVINQLKGAQFHLRKWQSNDSSITHQLVGEDSSDELLNLSNHEYSKTLGLLWACKDDQLLFSVNAPQSVAATKRTVLSIMAQVFDPLGLINPCILQAKIILQKLWSSKVSWDSVAGSEIQAEWSNFLKSLSHINELRIPRYITCDDPILCEIHTFSDASILSYSACTYIRSINNDNRVSVHLVAAKSRVAPLKPLTVPRLELCGALLAARLAEKVKSSLNIEIRSTTYWCDSTIVLGWIKSNKTHLLKQFVYNRIHEINTLTEPSAWHYVPTLSNPADIGSRGADARQLESSMLWWKGPDFLLKPKEEWPSLPTQFIETELPELKNQTCLHMADAQSVEFINKFSEFGKLKRITAYILRFIHNSRHPHDKHLGPLTLHELNNALISLCKISQQETFPNELKLLKNKKQLPSKNRVLNLSPFLDEDGLIRVGGRLSSSHYDYDTKHPILLHSSHHITNIIFKRYHQTLLHAGPQLLLANVRHKFWALNGRNLARKTVHNCVTCCRYSGRVKQPIMGNLPEQRLHAEHPFLHTAIDYAGPVMILNRQGRGSSLIKAYICIFVCLSVRAVHIELVSSLSSLNFIAALNRFIARRAKPANIFCDNATCFTGANKELARFLKLNAKYIGSYASDMSINFKFSPAYSPHFNGLAESAVKQVKYFLKKILALANLTYEEMNTVLTQIEAILNSRPLTPLSSDPSDLTALTPSHFLIGRTINVLPSPQVVDVSKLSTFSRYMRTQQLKAHFWDRFYKEYISELQKRQKWRNAGDELKLGELVLVKDDRLPPNRWLMGRVINVYKGSDNVARVADVKTTSGTLRRAFNRLCPLPVMDRAEQPSYPQT